MSTIMILPAVAVAMTFWLALAGGLAVGARTEDD